MNHYVHDLSPIAFWIEGYPVTWYWLNYLVSFLIISAFLLSLRKTLPTPLSRNDVLDHLVVSWFSALLGGRLGYILIYNPKPFFDDPSLIGKFWLGGMAFHGALIGYALGNLALARLKNRNAFFFFDLASIGVPIGLFTGRIFNFVGGELWGRPFDGFWAVIFPQAGPEPRHPSQLYEAFGEGLLLFALLWMLRMKIKTPGYLTAVFLAGYGVFRFVAEFFRAPDAQIGSLPGGLTLGQWLCVLMVALAGAVYYRVIKPTASKSS